MADAKIHKTVKRAQSLTREQVIAELRKNNINSLDDLVQARLDSIKDIGKPVAKSSGFIYKCFVLWDSDFTLPPVRPLAKGD